MDRKFLVDPAAVYHALYPHRIASNPVPPPMAQTLTKLKKGELVESANARLSGLRWLPGNLKAASTQEEQ